MLENSQGFQCSISSVYPTAYSAVYIGSSKVVLYIGKQLGSRVYQNDII